MTGRTVVSVKSMTWTIHERKLSNESHQWNHLHIYSARRTSTLHYENSAKSSNLGEWIGQRHATFLSELIVMDIHPKWLAKDIHKLWARTEQSTATHREVKPQDLPHIPHEYIFMNKSNRHLAEWSHSPISFTDCEVIFVMFVESFRVSMFWVNDIHDIVFNTWLDTGSSMLLLRR